MVKFKRTKMDLMEVLLSSKLTLLANFYNILKGQISLSLTNSHAILKKLCLLGILFKHMLDHHLLEVGPNHLCSGKECRLSSRYPFIMVYNFYIGWQVHSGHIMLFNLNICCTYYCRHQIFYFKLFLKILCSLLVLQYISWYLIDK